MNSESTAVPPADSPRSARDARLARIAQAIFAVMLLSFSAGDALSAIRLWNLDASTLATHEVDGWIDDSRIGKARAPVIRVSTTEGGVVALTFGIIAALALFCPILLIFHAIERLSRRKSVEVRSRIAAVQRWHIADGQ